MPRLYGYVPYTDRWFIYDFAWNMFILTLHSYSIKEQENVRIISEADIILIKILEVKK